MRQRVMRMAVAAGACTVALLLVLTMCSGDDRSATRNSAPTTAPPSPPPLTQLTVPAGYAPQPHWEISDASPEQAIARGSGRLAYLERLSGGRFRMRTLDMATGRPGWTGRPWQPPTGIDRSASDGSAGTETSRRFPRLLTVTQDNREFFVA